LKQSILTKPFLPLVQVTTMELKRYLLYFTS
jgi:hypothetical protein